MDPQSLFNQATELHRAGQLAQAEDLYRQVLRAAPAAHGAHFLLGTLQAQQGRGADALASYERAIGIKPDFAEALYNRGVTLWQMRRHGDALKSYDKMLTLMPRHAGAHFNRGVVLAELTRWEDAVVAYDAALAIQPDFAPALTNRGIALWTLRLHDAALESYDKALALNPDDVGTLYNRGLTLADMGRLDDAIVHYGRALTVAPQSPDILASLGLARLDQNLFDEALKDFDASLALRPDDVETLTNRGLALWALERAADALASYDKALALAPGFAAAWNNRALALSGMGLFPEALASLDQVLALEPQNADAWNRRGKVLCDLKRYEEAAANFSTAITIRPDFAEALNNRGYTAWANLGFYAQAVSDYERALAIDPDFINLRGELLLLRQYGGDWRHFESDVVWIDEGVRAGRPVAQPYIYQAISQSPADLQACSRIFARRFPLHPQARAHVARDRAKIRIGYVSGEFRDQATASLMAGLYERHDRDKFEIFAIDSGGGDDSPMRKRLEAAFDKFMPIAGLTDTAAADLIEKEEIDILINLNGYFGAPRMGVFARRPAPLQVNYLGFPATLGAEYMDYIIADETVIPAGERQFYNEKVIWLPGSYQANDDKRGIGEDSTRAAQNLPEDGFVFCNFNQSYKLTPGTFASWMRILKQTEGSVLWLLDTVRATSKGEVFRVFRENLGREAERHGVARERLIFAPFVPIEQHLARLKLADLFLDTLPYNAHTTASDALWAGLPLVTLRGNAFPGRVAASLLKAAGLPELVTETEGEFETLAITLAGDKKKLEQLRARLAKNRAGCALFDTQGFARHIESAYSTMWDIRRRGEAPREFTAGE